MKLISSDGSGMRGRFTAEGVRFHRPAKFWPLTVNRCASVSAINH